MKEQRNELFGLCLEQFIENSHANGDVHHFSSAVKADNRNRWTKPPILAVLSSLFESKKEKYLIKGISNVSEGDDAHGG